MENRNHEVLTEQELLDENGEIREPGWSRRMLQKYENQIPDFKSRAKAAGIGEAAPPPEVLEERCPECGAPLVKRMGRGRPFIGCSAFPKCRYIKPRNKE